MAIISFQVGSFNHETPGPSVTESGDTSRFHQVNFPSPFPGGTTPVVIPFVQTFNGCNTPGVRIAEVTNTGFKFRMNEVVVDVKKSLSDGHHKEETIGYIAFLPTS